MIPVKTENEIKKMRLGGKKLSRVMTKLLAEVRPGIRLVEIDRLGRSLIKKEGGWPSFQMVPGYDWATCLNINEGVVHGVPDRYQIKEGDLVSVDIGIFYQGLHTDMARTILVQTTNNQQKRRKDEFLKAGEKALRRAVKVARLGKRVGHISRAIEKEIKKAGFWPIRVLTGHGVGKELHESPQIPCFLAGEISETPLLKSRMTLAIEIIYTQGSPEVVLEKDGWTIKTVDGNLAALFEDTVAVTPKGPLVLTLF